MRVDGTLYFLLSDHPSTSLRASLGSTSLTTDADGPLVSELRYTAWGQVRYASGTTPTHYTFTGQYSNMTDFGLMFYNARWPRSVPETQWRGYDPALGRFAQADSFVPPGVQGYDRYAFVNNDPVRYTDPSGHMAWNGEGGDYTWEDQDNDAYVAQHGEQAKCDAGNYNHCSTVELIIKRHPKPVSGIHVGYSGQAGYGLEGGVYDQWDFLVDWKEGNLYVVQTVGTFIYGGTPTGIEGDVYLGTSSVQGIPRDVEDITDYLEGKQIDISGSINIDAGLFAGVGKGLNVNLDENGWPFYTPRAGYMYTTESNLVLGGNGLPNLFDINGQVGKSESFVMNIVPLWWSK